jgi:hypothetical protein
MVPPFFLVFYLKLTYITAGKKFQEKKRKNYKLQITNYKQYTIYKLHITNSTSENLELEREGIVVNNGYLGTERTFTASSSISWTGSPNTSAAANYYINTR